MKLEEPEPTDYEEDDFTLQNVFAVPTTASFLDLAKFVPATTFEAATEATNEVTGPRSRQRPRVQILKKTGNPVEEQNVIVNESPRRQLEVVSAPRRQLEVVTAPRRQFEVVTAPRRQFNTVTSPRRVRPTGKQAVLMTNISNMFHDCLTALANK